MLPYYWISSQPRQQHVLEPVALYRLPHIEFLGSSIFANPTGINGISLLCEGLTMHGEWNSQAEGFLPPCVVPWFSQQKVNPMAPQLAPRATDGSQSPDPWF